MTSLRHHHRTDLYAWFLEKQSNKFNKEFCLSFCISEEICEVLQRIYIWYYWTYQHANCNILSPSHQKREFDQFWCYSDAQYMNDAFYNKAFKFIKAGNTIACNHVMHQNGIKFVFQMAKVTKCCNLHFDAFNNNKYKFFTKLCHVSSLMEKLRQN